MHHLVVCVDGSLYTQACCAHAAWCAGRLPGARITLVYATDLRKFEVPLVADISGSLGIQPFQSVLGQVQEFEKQKAAAVFEHARRHLAAEGFAGEVAVRHETGLLVDKLVEVQTDADLVVLGKRGENADFASAHLGSTMERVVRASRVPCLVASRRFHPVARALVAFDGSATTRRALDLVLDSPLFADLELDVVTVAEEGRDDAALALLREAGAAADSRQRKVFCHLARGNPEDAISAHVAHARVDLLVMGAYGHSRIRHLLVGSTTTEMMRLSPVPLLVVR